MSFLGCRFFFVYVAAPVAFVFLVHLMSDGASLPDIFLISSSHGSTVFRRFRGKKALRIQQAKRAQSVPKLASTPHPSLMQAPE